MPDSVKITETQLEGRVKDLAERMGWLYYHTHRSQHSPAGFPDCLMLRGDRMVVAELKVGDNQITADQWEWLEHFKETGVEVFVWWDTDEGWDLMCEILR